MPYSYAHIQLVNDLQIYENIAIKCHCECSQLYIQASHEESLKSSQTIYIIILPIKIAICLFGGK